MATIASFGTTPWTTVAGNKQIAAVTPTDGNLIVCACGNSDRTTAQPPTITDTWGGGTYTQHPTAATTRTSLDSLWVFVRDNLVFGATSGNIDFTQSGDTGGGIIRCWQVTGMARSGLDAIRQVGKRDNQAAGTPGVTMGAAFLTSNPGFGAIVTASNISTNSAAPTSWNENSDGSYSIPSTGQQSISRSSGETGTTINWTAATATGFCSILVELDTTIPTVPEFLTEPRRP